MVGSINYFSQYRIGTVGGFCRDLKSWCIMIMSGPHNSEKIAAMPVDLRLIERIFCEILRAAKWDKSR